MRKLAFLTQILLILCSGAFHAKAQDACDLADPKQLDKLMSGVGEVDKKSLSPRTCPASTLVGNDYTPAPLTLGARKLLATLYGCSALRKPARDCGLESACSKVLLGPPANCEQARCAFYQNRAQSIQAAVALAGLRYQPYTDVVSDPVKNPAWSEELVQKLSHQTAKKPLYNSCFFRTPLGEELKPGDLIFAPHGRSVIVDTVGKDPFNLQQVLKKFMIRLPPPGRKFEVTAKEACSTLDSRESIGQFKITFFQTRTSFGRASTLDLPEGVIARLVLKAKALCVKEFWKILRIPGESAYVDELERQALTSGTLITRHVEAPGCVAPESQAKFSAEHCTDGCNLDVHFGDESGVNP